MFLVPVLAALDAPDAATAESLAAVELRRVAIHIGPARRLSHMAAVTAEFELRVYVNHIELPPAAGDACPTRTQQRRAARARGAYAARIRHKRPRPPRRRTS